MDPYAVLGITSDASVKEIRAAFLKKARQFHPDVNPSPEAKPKYLEAELAYATICSSTSVPKRAPSETAPTGSAMSDMPMTSDELWNAFVRGDKSLQDVIEDMIKDHEKLISSLIAYQPPQMNFNPPRLPDVPPIIYRDIHPPI